MVKKTATSVCYGQRACYTTLKHRQRYVQIVHRDSQHYLIYTVSQKKVVSNFLFHQLLSNIENPFTAGNGNKLFMK